MNELSHRSWYQFSIRDLLILTLVVSVSLMIALLSRGSRYVGALAMPWTWVSFLPIAVIWIWGRRKGVRRWLVKGSIVVYAVSMAVPALEFRGNDIAFGGQAWLASYAYGLGITTDFLANRNPPWLVYTGWSPVIAVCLGVHANTLLITGWIAFFVARCKRIRPAIARWLARFAFLAMWLSIIPIMCDGGLSAIYPGFGLWITSALMLIICY